MIVTICLWPDDDDFEDGLTLELKRVANEQNISISFKDDCNEHIFQSFDINLKLLKNAIPKLELSDE